MVIIFGWLELMIFYKCVLFCIIWFFWIILLLLWFVLEVEEFVFNLRNLLWSFGFINGISKDIYWGVFYIGFNMMIDINNERIDILIRECRGK